MPDKGGQKLLVLFRHHKCMTPMMKHASVDEFRDAFADENKSHSQLLS